MSKAKIKDFIESLIFILSDFSLIIFIAILIAQIRFEVIFPYINNYINVIAMAVKIIIQN